MKTPRPATKKVYSDVDVSAIYLRKNTFVQIDAGDVCVEVTRLEDNTVRVCCNDPSIVVTFEEAYGD